MRRNQHLVTVTNAASQKGAIQRNGTIGNANNMAGTQIASKFPFEFSQVALHYIRAATAHIYDRISQPGAVILEQRRIVEERHRATNPLALHRFSILFKLQADLNAPACF